MVLLLVKSFVFWNYKLFYNVLLWLMSYYANKNYGY